MHNKIMLTEVINLYKVIAANGQFDDYENEIKKSFNGHNFESINPIINYVVGRVYHYDGNHNCQKYYLRAIEKNNTDAMYWLGEYYNLTEKNYDLAKKYFLMAIDCGHVGAMSSLGQYYHYIEKNFDLTIKYYQMTVDNGEIFYKSYLDSIKRYKITKFNDKIIYT